MPRQRISFDTTDNIRAGIDEFPHGWRRMILNVLCEQVIAGYREHGPTFLGKIVSKQVTLQETKINEA